MEIKCPGCDVPMYQYPEKYVYYCPLCQYEISREQLIASEPVWLTSTPKPSKTREI